MRVVTRILEVIFASKKMMKKYIKLVSIILRIQLSHPVCRHDSFCPVGTTPYAIVLLPN